MWQPIGQAGSVSDRVAQQIIGLIDDDQLAPGDRLPAERDLAVMLGVSRPSLREAVKSLEAQGRLVVRHGQGVFVAAPRARSELEAALVHHEATLDELFAMREVLEVPAAGWAAQRGDSRRIAAAAAALAELNDAVTAGSRDFKTLGALDAAFHMRIVEAAGNRFLGQTLGVLQEMLAAGMETTLLIPGRLEKSAVEHREVLSAVLGGDSAAARKAARQHIRSARSAAMARLDRDRRRVQRGGAQATLTAR